MEALLCISFLPTIHLSLVVGSSQLWSGTQIWLFVAKSKDLTNLYVYLKKDLLQAGAVILVAFASLMAMRSWPPVCNFSFP